MAACSEELSTLCCQDIYAGSCTGFAGLFLLDFQTPSIWEQAELWSGRGKLNGSCACRNAFWQGREALREHSSPALMGYRDYCFGKTWHCWLCQKTEVKPLIETPQTLPLLIVFHYFCRKTKCLGRGHPMLCHPLSELDFHNSELVFSLLRKIRRSG